MLLHTVIKHLHFNQAMISLSQWDSFLRQFRRLHGLIEQ